MLLETGMDTPPTQLAHHKNLLQRPHSTRALAEFVRFDYERVAGTWLYRVSSTAPMVTILDFATHPSRGNLLGHGLDHPDERERRDWHALGVGA